MKCKRGQSNGLTAARVVAKALSAERSGDHTSGYKRANALRPDGTTSKGSTPIAIKVNFCQRMAVRRATVGICVARFAEGRAHRTLATLLNGRP
jgi:hypothetical protein